MSEQACSASGTPKRKKPNIFKKLWVNIIALFFIVLITIISYSAWFIIISCVVIGLLILSCMGLYYKIRGKVK